MSFNNNAKGKLIGQVYLLHFNISPGTVIPSSRPDALTKKFHARHYCGWAEDSERRIQEHREGTGARLMQVLKQRGITFQVARIWDNVARGFERQLKNQGGLSRHCPLCRAEGIDRDTAYKQKKEVQVAPETPTAGPDFVEVEKTAGRPVQIRLAADTEDYSAYLRGLIERDLFGVGPNKPLGYMPLSTVYQAGVNADQLEEQLKSRGLKVFQVHQHGMVHSGAIWAYDEAALNALLQNNFETLRKYKWPEQPAAFVKNVVRKSVGKADSPDLYRLIGLAFSDARFKTAGWREAVGERWIYHPNYGAFWMSGKTGPHILLIEKAMGKDMAFGKKFDEVDRGYAEIDPVEKTVTLESFDLRNKEFIENDVVDLYKKRFPKYTILIPQESDPMAMEKAMNAAKTGATVYNGGSGEHGKFVTYYTPNKKMAESYVEMYNDRFGGGGRLTEADVNITNPAPWDFILAQAYLLKMNREEIELYTPASIFDENLFGPVVGDLVESLRKQGYDGAILDDIGYGVQVQDKAYISFSPPSKIAASRMMKSMKFFLWAYKEDMGLRIKFTRKPENSHWEWFRDMGLPTHGYLYDAFLRGTGILYTQEKKVQFRYSWVDPGHHHTPEIVNAFQTEFPGCKIFLEGSGKMSSLGDTERWIYHPKFGAFATSKGINHAAFIEQKMGKPMSFGQNYDSVEKGYAFFSVWGKAIKLQRFNSNEFVPNEVYKLYKKRFPDYEIEEVMATNASAKVAAKPITNVEDLKMDENERKLIREEWTAQEASRQTHKLYHGTSSIYLDKLTTQGFRAGTYVTSDWHMAVDEAYNTVHQDVTGAPGVGGVPTVITLNVDTIKGPLMPDPEYIRGAIEVREEIYAWKVVNPIPAAAIIKVEQMKKPGEQVKAPKNPPSHFEPPELGTSDRCR